MGNHYYCIIKTIQRNFKFQMVIIPKCLLLDNTRVIMSITNSGENKQFDYYANTTVGKTKT